MAEENYLINELHDLEIILSENLNDYIEHKEDFNSEWTVGFQIRARVRYIEPFIFGENGKHGLFRLAFKDVPQLWVHQQKYMGDGQTPEYGCTPYCQICNLTEPAEGLRC